MTKRMAVLTSGGDAPGMNAAIRALTMLGTGRGLEVVGVSLGYRGLLEERFRPLGPKDVAHILREGGTILGSARCAEFQTREGRDRARAILKKHSIDALVVIGGNGSLTGISKLSEAEEVGGELETRVIGIPASIDNDVGLTSLAIGTDTAMNTIVDACDKIADTASAHERAFIVEVMGRQCGYLAMTAGIACAADVILFPESGSSEEEIVSGVVDAIKKARQRSEGRSKHVLIVKAEGVRLGTEDLKARVDETLEQLGGAPVETRVTVLGHVVRGGRPTAADRVLASRLAHGAVRLVEEGATRKMVGFHPPADVPESIGYRPPYDPQLCVVELDAMLDETAKLLDGRSKVVQRRAKMFREVADVLTL